MRYLKLVVLGLLVASQVLIATARAYVGGPQQLTVSPNPVACSGTLSVSGSDWPTYSTVYLRLYAPDNTYISGATTQTAGDGTFSNISIAVPATATTGTYSVQGVAPYSVYQTISVSVTCGGATLTPTATATATLVTDPPTITQQPASTTVCAGQTATFSASATNSTAVQWEVSTDLGASWSDVPGATTSGLSFQTDSSQNGNQYLADFSNAYGSTDSSAAVLAVDSFPAITSEPSGQAVVAGSDASFAVGVAGTPPPAISWQVSSDGGHTWTSLSHATGSSLSLSNVNFGMNGNLYRATATNACGSVTTTSASLRVTGVALDAGWNLVDVPEASSSLTSAAADVASIDASLGSGAVTSLAVYTNGRFASFVPGYSQDFPIQPYQGILIQVANPGVWTMPRDATAYTSSQSVPLQQGWNLVAAPFPAAGLRTDTIAGQIGTSVAEIAAYRGDRLIVYRPGIDSPFALDAFQGFWLLSTANLVWTPH